MIGTLFIAPGATVQDLGRDGFWSLGLGRAGVMDALSHQAANLLLGNDATAASIEIPLTPARFRFTEATGFALAGAVCGAALNGNPLPRVWAGTAAPGDVLELGTMTQGARVYLALPGGVDVPAVMGSRSTQLRESFGGFQGRVLATGDVLHAATPDAGMRAMTADLPYDDGVITVRALPSTEYADFTAQAQDAFWSQPYEVTPQSNRQGYRLDGTALTYQAGAELRSHGIGPGIVQVPGGGQPIIQLADSATMGGYPKIAAVIEPDLWRIAQARPGDALRFRQVSLAEAAEAQAEQDAILAALRGDLDRMATRRKGWA